MEMKKKSQSLHKSFQDVNVRSALPQASITRLAHCLCDSALTHPPQGQAALPAAGRSV